MKINISEKTLQELNKLVKLFPNGYLEAIENKVYWVFGR